MDDDSEFVWYWFGGDPDDYQDDCDENDGPEPEPRFVYPTRDELLEQITHANATATRLRDTAYWDRAHRHLNELLDNLIGR